MWVGVLRVSRFGAEKPLTIELEKDVGVLRRAWDCASTALARPPFYWLVDGRRIGRPSSAVGIVPVIRRIEDLVINGAPRPPPADLMTSGIRSGIAASAARVEYPHPHTSSGRIGWTAERAERTARKHIVGHDPHAAAGINPGGEVAQLGTLKDIVIDFNRPRPGRTRIVAVAGDRRVGERVV